MEGSGSVQIMTDRDPPDPGGPKHKDPEHCAGCILIPTFIVAFLQSSIGSVLLRAWLPDLK
jgi:hypothetical protein